MKTIICDDGSTAVKLAWLVNDKVTSSVTSNTATMGKSFSFGEQKVVVTEGVEFTFSESVPNRLQTSSRAYQTSDHSRASVWHALLSQDIDVNQELRCVATLPLSSYYKGTDKNIDLIAAKEASMLKPVTINDVTYQFKEVRVYPEGIPATFEFLYNRDGSPKADSTVKTIIVDCGGTTTDIAVITGAAEFIENATSLTNVAGGVIGRGIVSVLSADYGDVPAHVINNLIKGESALDGTITPEYVGLEHMCERMGKILIIALQEIVGEFRMVTNVVLVGGAAPLVEKVLKDNFKNVLVPGHGQNRLAESILEIEVNKGIS